MRKMIGWATRNHHYVLSFFSILALLLNISIYYQLTDYGNYARYCDIHRRYMFDHNAYLIKAVNIWSDFAKEPRNITMRGTYPNVIELEKNVCVSLAPLDLAGEPVYCFDKKSRHVTYASQNVE